MLGRSPLTQRGPRSGETSTEDLQARALPQARGLWAAPASETPSCPFRALALREMRKDQTLKEKHTTVSAAFLWHEIQGRQSSFIQHNKI